MEAGPTRANSGLIGTAMDTIYALSSGKPPAGIAVVRVTGARAGDAVRSLAERLPEPRKALHSMLRASDGSVLDDGLVLWFPGPSSVTGEDVAEFHLHGGKAIVAAVLAELANLDGLREAEAGEFTRRAFANGKIDLAEAEGLADLLTAETELQRRAAMSSAGGALSRQIEQWREQVLHLSAAVEAVLDFGDEDDVEGLSDDFYVKLAALGADLEAVAARPTTEVLREGFRVVIAGPPNAGKSTLFNDLVGADAAITAPVAGTTRDVLTKPVAIGGVPFVFVDTAGLRESGEDQIEAIGIERARGEVDRSDLVLWLGLEGEGPVGALEVDAQSDNGAVARKRRPDVRLSAHTGEGMDELRSMLCKEAIAAIPGTSENALNERQFKLVKEACASVRGARHMVDPLIIAEGLRQTRRAFDDLLGRTATEDVLDTLFGRLCIGK